MSLRTVNLLITPPVISGDASSARPSGLLVLLVVVGVDVGLPSLLLQDLSKLVFPNAAKERSHPVGLLDHPLRAEKLSLISANQRRAMLCLNESHLSDLYGVLCGSSGVVFNFELLHQLLKPTDGNRRVIKTSQCKPVTFAHSCRC